MDLAAHAGTTPRYLSFVETGRARPGRDIVLRLARALELPVREQNALLWAAGLPPAYPERALDEAAMLPVQRVLRQVLDKHDPYPGWVITTTMRVVAANRTAQALFPGLLTMPPEALVDMWFGTGPYRDSIDNWSDVVWAALHSLRRDCARNDDPTLVALLQRAERYVEGLPPPKPEALLDLPVICPRLRVNGQLIRTITTVMRFDTAVEVSTSELRVELMFPADEPSAEALRALTILVDAD